MEKKKELKNKKMNMMDIGSGEMRIKKESIMSETDVSMRKAKIVCTMGS